MQTRMIDTSAAVFPRLPFAHLRWSAMTAAGGALGNMFGVARLPHSPHGP